MKVYIHKPKGTEFADDWLYAAYKGFTQLGADIKFFDQVEEIPYAPDNVVVTFVEDTKSYLYQNGLIIPKPLNIPEQLNHYHFLHREITTSVDVSELEELGFQLPLFIKPADSIKEFQGDVLKDWEDMYLLGIAPFTNVFVSEHIHIDSEYRCFIHNGQVVGIKHYLGDFDKFPEDHLWLVRSAIESYGAFSPVAYTIDIAVASNIHSMYDNKYTAIIECNDAWSICNYGLDPKTYAIMLRDRWFEITGFRKFKD